MYQNPDSLSSDRAGALSTTTYYRSKHLSPPLIYAQQEAEWFSYRPDGTLLGRGTGPIPETILAQVEEIDAASAGPAAPGGHRGTAAAAGSDTVFEFKPRMWRYLLVSLVGMAPALGLAVAAVVIEALSVSRTTGPAPVRDALPGDDWFLYLIAGAIVVSILDRIWLARRDGTIRVTGGKLSGPGPLFWWWSWRLPRRTIPLTQLECVLSARRSWLDRVLGRQILYSADGDRIYLHRWAFDSPDVRRILVVLGIERDEGR